MVAFPRPQGLLPATYSLGTNQSERLVMTDFLVEVHSAFLPTLHAHAYASRCSLAAVHSVAGTRHQAHSANGYDHPALRRRRPHHPAAHGDPLLCARTALQRPARYDRLEAARGYERLQPVHLRARGFPALRHHAARSPERHREPLDPRRKAKRVQPAPIASARGCSHHGARISLVELRTFVSRLS